MITRLPDPEIIKKFSSKQSDPVKIEKNGMPAGWDGKLLSVWVDITPAIAAQWLKNNFRNRPINWDVVNSYAREIVTGLWQPTHQGIAFNDQDRLIDGQHRLHAIVKSGKVVRVMVTFGLPSRIEGHEATLMDCVDRGHSRSIRDQLKIQHGIDNGGAIASICSALAHLCFGERVRKLSVGQTLEIYRAFQTSIDYFIKARPKKGELRSVGMLAGFVFVHAVPKDAPIVESFFKEFAAGSEKLKMFPGLSVLHAFLSGDQAKAMARNMIKGMAELTVHTLWKELQNKSQESFLETRPENWLSAVEYFRNEQADRVAKVATMFKLPVKETGPIFKSQAPKYQPRPAAEKERPSLDTIFSKVETYFQLSKYIIAGKGRDVDMDAARVSFVHLARGVGHTIEAVAAVLKRPVPVVREMELPSAAFTAKQRAAVAALKEKLS